MDMMLHDNSQLEDWEAWTMYPEHRWVFNKLELALRLGYAAGPVPCPVAATGEYVVRPIYNLSGMAAGAKIMTLQTGQVYNLPPGHFWCKRFVGEHVSVNYEQINGVLTETHTSIGETDYDNLSRFRRWTRVDNRNIALPSWIDQFAAIKYLNIEFIGDRMIEIHLRSGTDFPDDAVEIVPVYSTTAQQEIDQLTSMGYLFKESYMDAEKNIADARLGWLYK